MLPTDFESEEGDEDIKLVNKQFLLYQLKTN